MKSIERTGDRDMTWHNSNPARYALFHRLWGKASLAAGYVKDEWISFERVLFSPDLGPLPGTRVEDIPPVPPAVPTGTPFDTAKWYSVDQEDGKLEHESAEAALQEYLEVVAQEEGPDEPRDNTLREAIDIANPVEVQAWNPKPIDDKFIQSQVEGSYRDFEEAFSEEYGNPDSDAPTFKQDVAETLKAELAAAFEKVLAATRVWQCEVVGSREYTEEELLEMFKDEIKAEEDA